MRGPGRFLSKEAVDGEEIEGVGSWELLWVVQVTPVARKGRDKDIQGAHWGKTIRPLSIPARLPGSPSPTPGRVYSCRRDPRVAE